VPWLPLVASLLIAAVVAPRIADELRARGLVRENYRRLRVPCPAGIGIAAAALVALAPVTLFAVLAEVYVFAEGTLVALLYVPGVMLLGLVDDLMGSAQSAAGDAELPRGWRGHARAAAGGRVSTGAVKAVGTLGLAALALGAGTQLFGDQNKLVFLVAVLLVVTTTNFFNLLDLRPGRSIKALLLLGAGLLIGTQMLDPLWALGLFVAPILVLLPLDLGERGMLGDTGSNAVGAVAGLWLVFALPVTGQLIALALVLAATIYGEFRSISELVERTPGLRELDSLGRTHA
jgi:UDP-GlcNAc:undecaprenyl-phosphate/decaprenyl-phosphate GlcNAc-1-phosphate transferase